MGESILTTRGMPTQLGVGLYLGGSVSPAQRQIIEASIREGLSGSATSARLRVAGLGLRRQTTLSVIREIRGAERRQPAIRSVPNRFRATATTITPTKVNLATRFRIRGHVNVINRITGLPDRIYINFGSDKDLTLGEMRQRTQDIFDKAQATGLRADSGSPPIAFQSLDITRIEEMVL